VRWSVGSVCRGACADSYLATGDTFAVADGMGKGKGAVLSSRKAVELLSQMRPYRSEEELRQAFLKINKEIIKEVGKLGDTAATGTTLSALALDTDRYFLAHVGDSRIYLLRDGELSLLTVDQVRLKGRRKVVRVLGLDWSPEVFTRSGELKEGDTFLLISDGFLDVISEEELKQALSGDSVEECANTIGKLFEERSEDGELTFVVVKL